MSTRINLTHAQSRERNARFVEIVRLPETQDALRNLRKDALRNLRKSKHVGYLKKLCEEQYQLRMPMSAIYKLMPEVDEQFGVRNSVVAALDSSGSTTESDSN